MGDGTARLDAALLGLDGFVIITTAEVGGELELLVETTADLVGCPGCGAVARAKDRRRVWVRDLPIGGRPVVLCWWKRVWCCPHPLCEVKTWTERHEAIASRACLTERARQRQSFGERSSRSASGTRRSPGSLRSLGWPGGR